MSLVFTDYVRLLASKTEPTAQDFEPVWDKLRDALRSEMMKRSVWSAPPSYLGVYGYDSWSQRDAFDEILNDCYIYVFHRRQAGLASFLEVEDNIEGLVFRNIRYFLFEKQKQHDPLGYRVFRVLKTATRQAIDAGTVHVLAGNPKVANATVLGHTGGNRLKAAEAAAEGAALRELVGAWCDELLPELVTARGAKLDEVVEGLAGHLARLATHGIEVFRFKDLIDALKQDVRGRWGALWQTSQGETAFDDGGDKLVSLVRLVRPDSGFEERDVFEKLLACMAEALERLQTRQQTRVYLERLWTLLRAHAAENEPASGPELPVPDRLPSGRKIADLLDIPRYRLPDLKTNLGDLVQTCKTDATASESIHEQGAP